MHSAPTIERSTSSDGSLKELPGGSQAERAAQALIQEARMRQRHRWELGVAIGLVAAVGVGFGLAYGLGSGAPSKPRSSSRSPEARSRTLSSLQDVPTSSVLKQPEALVVMSDGSVLISNVGSNQVLRMLPDGTVNTLAGTGVSGFVGDGRPATSAELNSPGGLAISSDGTVYLVDTGNGRIREISKTGTITTAPGATGLSQPTSVAVGPGNNLFVTDDAGVQEISSDSITTVVAAGPNSLDINGSETAFAPDAIAFDSTGDMFVANSSPKMLVEFSPTRQVINSWQTYVSPAGLSSNSAGEVVVADYGNLAVDAIKNNSLSQVKQFHLNEITGLKGVFRPSGIAISPAGAVYTDTDGINGGAAGSALGSVSSGGQFSLQLLAKG